MNPMRPLPGSLEDKARFPPHPGRSSFHLPPPIPSGSSPHAYPPNSLPTHPAPPIPQHHLMDPTWKAPERSRSRWSPVLSSFSERPMSSSSRLPSISDYPRGSISSSSWDAASPSTLPTWATRPSTYPQPPTPITNAPPLTRPSSDTPRESPINKHGNESPKDSSKKKKRRVALSCAECAKRKQRCNRETPCQHCVARRVPELCLPYTRVGSPPLRATKAVDAIVKAEAPRPPSMLPTLSVRVSRIEALLNAVVNKVDGLEGKALSDWRINHAPATTPPPIHSTTVSRRNSDDRPLTASTESERNTAVMELDRESVYEPPREEEVDVAVLDLDSGLRNPLPQSMVKPTPEGVPLGLDYHGTPSEQLQALFKTLGMRADKFDELRRELPEGDLARRLMEWFFAKFNYVRYPIDEGAFRKSFEDLYASATIDAFSVLFLPVVFAMLALAFRIAPEDWFASEGERKTQSLRMYWNCKSAIVIAQAIKSETIQLVETRILVGLYLILMHDRRLAEGWAEFRAAIATGQALGLHRDGTMLRLDDYQTEYRRRLWSYLIHADATYSCLLGRPISIDQLCCDTNPPSNIGLSELREGEKASPKPLTEPTFATYLILRRELGAIVARVTKHFQRLHVQTSYRDVEALDAEFRAFITDLPPAFQMTDPDKSYDDQLWFLPVHRYYIQTEILHFIIILHRPWLLRRLRSSKYALSRQACFEAASTDFRIRQAFKRDVPDFFETLLASSFREFNCAMIAGISIIIDPRSPYSQDMKAILESFRQHFPFDPKADDFSKKEAAIIDTLHRRAKELEAQRLEASLHRPRSSSFRLDNISAERTETISQPRQHGELHPTPSSNASTNAVLWRNSPLMGSGTGTSPDEDQPQQLLDHWLISNTSFGPPLSQLDPSQTAYLGVPAAAIQTFVHPTMPYHGLPINGMVHGANTLGMDPGHPPPQGVFMPVVDANILAHGNVGDAQWGDGNSAQYWNTLVDGIVGKMGAGF